MSHLLLFLSSLLQYLSFYTPSLVTLASGFPKTLYLLRKDRNLRASYTTYIVCTFCHSLYSESECVPVRGSLGICSQKCRHVEYPNHPQKANRKECGVELLKKVKVSQTYKFVPPKVYVYYSIVESLRRLYLSHIFLSNVKNGDFSVVLCLMATLRISLMGGCGGRWQVRIPS